MVCNQGSLMALSPLGRKLELREPKEHDLLSYNGGCELENIAGKTNAVCYMNRETP